MKLEKKYDKKTQAIIDHLSHMHNERSIYLKSRFMADFGGSIMPTASEDKEFMLSFFNDPFKLEVMAEIERIISISIPTYTMSGEEIAY